MGIIKHKDLFASKYITAIVSDSNDRGYFIPIKKTLGDFWFTELNGNMYGFTLAGARILTYREMLTKSVRFVEYDTSHYASLQSYYKELELALIRNSLPKMNRVQLAALRILGRKETWQVNGKEISRKKYELEIERNKLKDRIEEYVSQPVNSSVPQSNELIFKPFEIKILLDELTENQDDFPEETENMINYLKSLEIDKIVTPIGRLTDSLQDDLITTKASYLGEVLPRLQRLDNEHKGIANKPITGKLPYLKLLLVIMMIGGIVGFVFVGIDMGWFNEITAMFPDFTSAGTGFSALNPASSTFKPKTVDKCSDEELQKRYTPLELKIAVESGTETCKLSPQTQDLIKNVELPKVEAAP